MQKYKKFKEPELSYIVVKYYFFLVFVTTMEVQIKKYLRKKNQLMICKMFLIWLQKKMNQNLTKDISCECKCIFNGRSCNSDQMWNNDKCWCECKKTYICEQGYIRNPSTLSCENWKCLAIMIDDSVITCDQIIE